MQHDQAEYGRAESLLGSTRKPPRANEIGCFSGSFRSVGPLFNDSTDGGRAGQSQAPESNLGITTILDLLPREKFWSGAGIRKKNVRGLKRGNGQKKWESDLEMPKYKLVHLGATRARPIVPYVHQRHLWEWDAKFQE